MVAIMVNCRKCNSILGEDAVTCPICGAEQSVGEVVEIDNIDKTLTSSPNILSQGLLEDERMDNEAELERLIKRGDECFNAGKKWLGAKDRSRARKDFQRAFNYYDTALKIDPNNDRIREARSKCLFKMA
jgi:tetratricopeptide (TPR) repeat protein